MADDPKKNSIDSMLRDAAIEKFGLKGVMDEIEKVKPLLEQVAAGAEVLKGKDGKTPELGKDYLTEEQQQSALEMVRPVKGKDYNDGEPGKDGYTPVVGVDYFTEDDVTQFVSRITPKKGKDYFTPEDLASIKVAVTPVKGADYNDGANPTPAQFIEVVKTLKGKDAAAFSEAVGAKIDISHVRNAGSFIFNGKNYKTEELMHGGGGGAGSGTVTSVAASGGTTGMTFSGSPITTSGTLTLEGTLAIANGGTGQITAPLAINALLPSQGGHSGEFLTTNGTVASWGAAGGSGTVTSVSVVSANGFAGTVATATTTPAITLTTTITGILSGNGTAISAASTTGSGAVVLANTPTLITPVIGAATGTSLVVSGALQSNTSLILQDPGAGTDTITIQAPTLSGGYTLTLPTDDGTSNQFLQTNGSGVLTWATGSAGTVTSVSGTSNRITSTGGTTPVIDIAATYVGQTSITTLGTITTGTWTGTTIAIANGGTGATSKAAAFDALSPMTTGGDLIYGGASGTGTRLANGTAGFVLTSAGTTLAPTWSAPAAATTITVANEATDTSCFPVFVTAATGDLGPKSNAGLTFNSNTALLTSTLLVGTTSVTSATIRASSNDSGSLGVSGTAFSDLFLASGAVIDFAAGNSVITHTSAVLTVTTGDLRVTSANVGTNADSVPTLSSTSTLTNKTLTSPTIQTSPVLAAATNLKFTVPSSDVTGTGITTNEFNSGYSSTAIGDLVYLDSSATWQKADADASAATYSSLLGIALSVTASGAAATVLLQGFVYAASPFPTFTIGAPIYMSATAGAVTQTAPVTTDSATRIVGYGVHADKMWFNPSNDWITHT